MRRCEVESLGTAHSPPPARKQTSRAASSSNLFFAPHLFQPIRMFRTTFASASPTSSGTHLPELCPPTEVTLDSLRW